MSAVSYEKAQTHIERQKARQKQLDMMEATASGQSDLPSHLTPPGSVHSHTAPADAIDNARRFLWDEDEEEFPKGAGYNNPIAGSVHDSSHMKNLMGSSGQPPHGGGITGRVASMVGGLPRLTAKTGLESEHDPVNLAPRRQQSQWGHADAQSRSLESEEYMGQSRGNCFSRMGDCVIAFINIFVGCLALLVECIVGCISEMSPKLFALLCGGCIGMCIFVFAIVAIVHRLAGGSAPASKGLTPIEDEVRFHSLRNAILESAFTQKTQLDAHGSAQNLALRWLTDFDPAPMETDDDSLLQRYALAVFYFSTYLNAELHDQQAIGTPKEGGWIRSDNWMSEKGICLWYGVTCPPHLHSGAEVSQYNENSDVLKLNLTENNVAGPIPSELVALENLQSLDLGNNMITGTIPKAILSLRLLDELYLQDNELSGTIPDEVGNLVAIRDLFIGTNKLAGKIPSGIGKLTLIRALGLDENLLTGPIPNDVWKCSNLLILYLDSNQLQGTISSNIKNLKQVIDLRLRSNAFSGSLPKEIQELVHIELMYLDDNALTGTIPDIFALTPRLQELQLYKNKFTGALPSSISSLKDLKVFYGDNNRFVGTLPKAYGDLIDLQTFYLFNNKLTGNIPSEFSGMANLGDLQLYNNKFIGQIPTQLGLNYKLVKFEAQDNALTGTVPTEFGLLESLKMLKVHNNKIVGTMPAEVCALKDKFDLDFVTTDCNTKGGGTVVCSCCNACYPNKG